MSTTRRTSHEEVCARAGGSRAVRPVTLDVEASDLDASYIGRLVTFGVPAAEHSTVMAVVHGQLRSITHMGGATHVSLIGPEATSDREPLVSYQLHHDTAIELD